jgi:TetR/AcrR family fatty acid metabolism transcriptional regulator
MPDPTSRRERRYARRRQEILAAAAHVFAEKGYRDSKISEIARALDIADGTIYNYFASKRDILMAIMDKARTDARVLEPNPAALRTRADLVSALVAAYDALLDHLPFMRTLLVEAWSDDAIMRDYLTTQMTHIRQPIEAYIRARIEAGKFRPVDAALVTQMVLGMLVAPIVPVLRGAVPPPTHEQRRLYAETSIDVFMDGVRVRGQR